MNNYIKNWGDILFLTWSHWYWCGQHCPGCTKGVQPRSGGAHERCWQRIEPRKQKHCVHFDPVSDITLSPSKTFVPLGSSQSEKYRLNKIFFYILSYGMYKLPALQWKCENSTLLLYLSPDVIKIRKVNLWTNQCLNVFRIWSKPLTMRISRIRWPSANMFTVIPLRTTGTWRRPRFAARRRRKASRSNAPSGTSKAEALLAGHVGAHRWPCSIHRSSFHASWKHFKGSLAC